MSIPLYDVGDIFYSSPNQRTYMVVERRIGSTGTISRYKVLCLESGKTTTYFTQDIDANSKLVA